MRGCLSKVTKIHTLIAQTRKVPIQILLSLSFRGDITRLFATDKLFTGWTSLAKGEMDSTEFIMKPGSVFPLFLIRERERTSVDETCSVLELNICNVFSMYSPAAYDLPQWEPGWFLLIQLPRLSETDLLYRTYSVVILLKKWLVLSNEQCQYTPHQLSTVVKVWRGRMLGKPRLPFDPLKTPT